MPSQRLKRTRIALSIGLLAFGLSGCAQSNYTWGWHIVSPLDARGLKNLAFLADGFVATISISLTSIAVSIALGVIVALMALSKRKPARVANRVYVETLRAVPLLVLLLWVYYGLPVVLGLQFGVFAAGVIALSLSDSAFEAEIFRGGIQSIDIGQREAAQALGLSPWHTMRLVILPQALRRILPSLGNQFVYMLKMSSLISVVGYQELTRRANELTLVEYRPLEIYTMLVIEYLILIVLASMLVRWLEQRLAANQTVRR